MDPISVAATITTLYEVVVELNKIKRRFANAGRTLSLILHDCDQILTILQHFKDLLQRRSQLVPPAVDGINFLRLQTLLVKNCNELTQDVKNLGNQLKTFTGSETRGEFLMNYVRMYTKLRPLEQAHTAIGERLKDFRAQKSSWDR
jgi:hypothetical protein